MFISFAPCEPTTKRTFTFEQKEPKCWSIYMLSNVYPSWIHAILLILLKNSVFFKRSYMQGYLCLTLAEYQNGPGMSDLMKLMLNVPAWKTRHI